MKNFIAISVFAASTLVGQTTGLKGNYYFEEAGTTQTGQAFHVASILSFDGQGQLQGTQYVKGLGSASQTAIRGNYALQGANGTLVLERTVADLDAESGSRFEASRYQLLKTADGTFSVLRVDFGVLSDGTMSPLNAAALLKGDFAITERGSDVLNQAFISLGSWTFDGNGNVLATVSTRGYGSVQTTVFTGRLSPNADGTFDLLLTGPTPDLVDGATDAAPAPVLAYKLIPNGKTFEALRIDSGVLADTSVSAK